MVGARTRKLNERRESANNGNNEHTIETLKGVYIPFTEWGEMPERNQRGGRKVYSYQFGTK